MRRAKRKRSLRRFYARKAKLKANKVNALRYWKQYWAAFTKFLAETEQSEWWTWEKRRYLHNEFNRLNQFSKRKRHSFNAKDYNFYSENHAPKWWKKEMQLQPFRTACKRLTRKFTVKYLEGHLEFDLPDSAKWSEADVKALLETIFMDLLYVDTDFNVAINRPASPYSYAPEWDNLIYPDIRKYRGIYYW